MRPIDVLWRAKELLDARKVDSISEAILYVGGITEAAQQASIILGKADWDINEAILLAEEKTRALPLFVPYKLDEQDSWEIVLPGEGHFPPEPPKKDLAAIDPKQEGE